MNNDNDVRRAEKEVKRNMDNFDTAMDHLKETIDDGSSKIDYAVHLASTPKRVFTNTVSRMHPYFLRAKPYAVDRRFQIGLLSVLGGMFLGSILLRRNVRSEMTSPLNDTDVDMPVIHTTVTDERIIVARGSAL